MLKRCRIPTYLDLRGHHSPYTKVFMSQRRDCRRCDPAAIRGSRQPSRRVLRSLPSSGSSGEALAFFLEWPTCGRDTFWTRFLMATTYAALSEIKGDMITRWLNFRRTLVVVGCNLVILCTKDKVQRTKYNLSRTKVKLMTELHGHPTEVPNQR